VGSLSQPKLSPQKHKEDTPAEDILTQFSPRTSVDRCYPHFPIQSDAEAGLLGCFHQLLTGVTYRGWASGAIIEDRQISLVSCDRGGLVRSSSVDMGSPEGFQLLCDWVLTLGSRSMEQWGFTNLFGNVGKPIQGTEFDVPLTDLHLSFGRLRHRQLGIFGRCTDVYDVTVKTGDTNIDSVCKIAWPLLSRPNEHALLEKVHAIDPAHTPDVHCAWDVFVELPSKRLRPHCTNASPIEGRTMRVTVMTKYQPIGDLVGNDFLSAFTQIMQCMLSSLLPLNDP
jgi:Fungal protein kinase